MTRGKYANTAAAREARESAIAEAAQLRHDVAKLTNELTTERASHAAATKAAQAEVRRLAELNATGTSDELERSNADADRMRREVRSWKNAHRVISDAFDRLGDALQDAYEAAGASVLEGRERAFMVAKYCPAPMSDECPGFIRCEDIVATVGTKYATNFATRLNPADVTAIDPDEIARIHRLQRAKGLRK